MSARILACLVALTAPTSAAADRTAYHGENAERLKCAVMLSLAGGFAKAEGRLKPGAFEKSRVAVAQLLAPLPGTSAEKAQAMQAMADRIMVSATPGAMKADFERTLTACARFF